MLRQYFKQAIQMLKENPLVNTISILGTALSIAMIMVVVLVIQVKLADYAPESRRNSMLYVVSAQAAGQADNGNNNGRLSAEAVKECFYTLQKPEAVTAIQEDMRAISLPGKRLYKEYWVKYTDAGFWKVFDFNFVQGAPFMEADFRSGITRAVISTDLAAALFQTTDVVGKTIVIDYVDYIVTGVVKPVSRAAEKAYGDVWIPYSTIASLMESRYNEGMSGVFSTVILANNRSDFDEIRKELDQRTALYNEGKRDYKLNYMSCPLTRLDIAAGSNGFQKKDIRDYFLSTGGLLLFLLLIPALNITGVMQSSMNKRRGEMGVRKAFGATQGRLISQILYENFIITMIGGIAGLLFSFVLLEVSKSFMLTSNTALTVDMLFKPWTFVLALLFVLLLNLLSAGIPAMRISREQIVNALKDTDENL